MSLSLKEQLNKLKLNQNATPVLEQNAAASFLFDFKNSKRIDSETIFQIGYTGLIELSREDQNFTRYFDVFFNSTSKYYNREMRLETENRNIDFQLKNFISDLSPYFLTKSCHKIIEYLIKVFKANVYSSKSLFFAFLPFYNSKYFIKLIQNINFENFKSLKLFSDYAKSGTVISKDFLFKEISNNFDLLREICNFYEENDLKGSSYIKFIVEIVDFLIVYKLNNYKNNDYTNYVLLIVKCINRILKNFQTLDDAEQIDEATSLICEIIIKITQKLNLSENYLTAIITEFIKKIFLHPEVVNQEKLLKTLLILSSSNNTCFKLSSEATLVLKDQFELNFKAELFKLSENYDLSHLIINIIEVNTDLALDIVNNNYLNEEAVKKLLYVLFNKIIKQQDSHLNESLLCIVKILEHKYLECFNKTLIEIFSNNKDINNNNKSNNYAEKIKNQILNEISESYKNLFSNEHNSYQIFLQLNTGNVINIISAIEQVDNNVINKNLTLEHLCVPALALKFSSLSKEQELEAVLKMKNLQYVIENYSNFKETLIDFYSYLNFNENNIYKNDLKLDLNQTLLESIKIFNNNNTNDTISGQDFKIILLTFVYDIDNLKYLNKNFPAFINKNFDYNSFIIYLQVNINIFIDLFIELLENDKFVSKINEQRMVTLLNLVKDVLNKVEGNTREIQRQQFEKIVAILDNKALKENSNFNLKEQIINILIEVIPENNKDIFFNLIYKLASLVLKYNIDPSYKINLINNKFFLNHNLNSNSQHFLSYLLIKENCDFEIIKNVLSAANNNNNKKELEFSLLVSLIYNLQNEVVNKKIAKNNKALIFDFLQSLDKSIEFKFTNFNSLFNDNKQKEDKISLYMLPLINDILENKNEILSNGKNITILLNNSSHINKEFFITFLQVFAKGLTRRSDTNMIEDVFILIKDKSFTFNLTEQNKIITIASSLAKEEHEKEAEIINYLKLPEDILESLLKSNNPNIKNLLENLIKTQNKFSNQFILNFVSYLDKIDFKKEITLFVKFLEFLNNFKYNVPIDSLPHLNIDYLSLLNSIQDSDIIKTDEILIFVIDLIVFQNNGYLNFKYILIIDNILTAFLEEKTKDKNQKISFSEASYLSLINSFFTILDNCSLQKEEVKHILNLIKGIENNIFTLLNFFFIKEDNVSNDIDMREDNNYDGKVSTFDNQFEVLQILNLQFLCLNKLIILTNNQSENELNNSKNILKDLIKKCFNIIKSNNKTQLRQITSVLIKSMLNFIQLLLSNKQILMSSENEFREYTESFISFSFENLLDKTVLEEFLKDLFKIIKIDSKTVAFFLMKFNQLNYEKYNEGVNSSLKFLVDNDNNSKEEKENDNLNFSLNIIKEVLKETAKEDNEEAVYSITNNNNDFNSKINLEKFKEIKNLHFSFINALFLKIESMFFNEVNLNYQDLKELILLLKNNQNALTKENFLLEKDKRANLYKLNIVLIKEIENFENNLFFTLFDSNHLNLSLVEAVVFDKKQTDSYLKRYFLSKYLDIIIIKEKSKLDLNLFSSFFDFALKNEKEDRINLQIIFSILTRLLVKNSEIIINSLQKTNAFKNIFKLLSSKISIKTNNKSSKDNLSKDNIINVNITKDADIYFKASVLVFLTKVFTLYENSFFDYLNEFLDLKVDFLKDIIDMKNDEVAVLYLKSLRTLTDSQSSLFSPVLNSLIINLLNLSYTLNTNSQIPDLINSILTSLATNQLFNNTYNAVKDCLKYLIEDKKTNKKEIFILLFNYFNNSIKHSDKLIIAHLSKNLLKFFIRNLMNHDINDKEEKISATLLDCFKSFVLKINEKQLKVLFEDILLFAKELNEETNFNFKYNLKHSIVSFQLINIILKTINSIFVSYFPRYDSYLKDLLQSLNTIFSVLNNNSNNNKSTSNINKKKDRDFFDESFDDENNKFSYLYLNTLILENILLNFKYNKDQLLVENIESLFEPLASQVN